MDPTERIRNPGLMGQFQAVLWVRIRIHFSRLNPDPHPKCGSRMQAGKNDPHRK
jgi:hypothetical protein